MLKLKFSLEREDGTVLVESKAGIPLRGPFVYNFLTPIMDAGLPGGRLDSLSIIPSDMRVSEVSKHADGSSEIKWGDE